MTITSSPIPPALRPPPAAALRPSTPPTPPSSSSTATPSVYGGPPSPLKFWVPDHAPSSAFLFSFPDTPDAASAGRDDRDRAPELRIFSQGFDLDPRDTAAIVYLLTLISSTHASAILGFHLPYTATLGIIFFSVVAFHLRKPVSIIKTIYYGAQVGMRWLTGFVFLSWAARDTLIQFLCIWLFADVQDQNVLFKLFVKVASCKEAKACFETGKNRFVQGQQANNNQNLQHGSMLV